jgi:uncharacterized protein YegL
MIGLSKRCAAILVVDNSIEMKDSGRLDLINYSLHRFIHEACMDSFAGSALDISIITFSDAPSLVQDLISVRSAKAPRCVAGGGSAIGQAITLALEVATRHVDDCRRQGLEVLRPWIWVLSHGRGTDADWNEAAASLKAAEQMGKVFSFPIAIDASSDWTTLKQLSSVQSPMLLQEVRFHEHFKYLPYEGLEKPPTAEAEDIKDDAERIRPRKLIIPWFGYAWLVVLVLTILEFHQSTPYLSFGNHTILGAILFFYGVIMIIPLMMPGSAQRIRKASRTVRRHFGWPISEQRAYKPSLFWTALNAVHLLSLRAIFLLLATAYGLELAYVFAPHAFAGGPSGFGPFVVLVLRETVPPFAFLADVIASQWPTMEIVKSSVVGVIAQISIYCVYGILLVGAAKTLWRLGRDKGAAAADDVISVGAWASIRN